MDCVLEAPTAAVEYARTSNAFAAKRLVEAPLLNTLPRCRNTFCVSHASKHPDAATARAFLDKYIPQQRTDMDVQRDAVRQHQQARFREIVEASERKNAMSVREKVIGVKCLMHLAAQKSLQHAKMMNHHPIVIHSVRHTWRTLLLQLKEYLNDNGFGEIQEEEEAQLAFRCRGALENVSALGVWFVGAMSIPFRRYAVRIPTEDGTLQDFVVIGLASFTYSSYVMDDRRLAQEATLAELERLSKRLSVNLLFLPPLLLPEEPLRDNTDFTQTKNASMEMLIA
ncbi:hypothetical protein TcYC6_0092240 [Trypanosoma cruzi]|uniref:Uncharacterized protein n=1 Tax=Trypanosoma cruzi TaxID=5693 RepID=A0A7J6XXV6_TRYCR|nr:hypothetical protein ECC02_008036 [Trypanosoma cruzi]KAF8295480.1 hypothetical protein TcYC6_0092240 [Trypanosoma cruzi]